MTGYEQECPEEQDAVLLALHALEPDQAAIVARHVRSCATCRRTVQDVEETFADIAEATPRTPPSQLRQRIMAAVREDGPPVVTRIAPRRAARAARPSTVVAPQRGPRRWTVAVAAAVVVLGIAGGGVVVAQLDRQREAATVHAATPGEVLTSISATVHAVLVDRARHPVAAVVLDDPQRFYDLDVAPAPPGRMWVLWGARGRLSTALATVPAGNAGETTNVSLGDRNQYEAYLLTQEPDGPLPARPGEAQASGPVVAAGP